MEHHKKALKKLIKWGIKLITVVIGLSPVFTTLMLGGIVMAVFGKSSSTSSGRVTMRPNVSESDTAAYIWEFFIGNGYTETQTAAILGNLEWESRLNYKSYTKLKRGTAMGIAQWTTYSGKNSLELYADSQGMEWDDLELQCMAIDATLHNQNPYSGWYNTRMSAYYGVTKADFWDGDLYDATMSFFCCFEDPEEYPAGCNNHGYVSAEGCLSVSFNCGNRHGRYPYAQAYLDLFSGTEGNYHDENNEDEENQEDAIAQIPQGGMEIPLYLQGNYTSMAWGDTNLGKSGCGPTCLAMVMSYLLG